VPPKSDNFLARSLVERFALTILAAREDEMNEFEDDDFPAGPIGVSDRWSWLKPKRPAWVRPDWWKDEYDDVPGARYLTQEELEEALERERKRLIRRIRKHLADQSKPPPTPEEERAKEIKRYRVTLARARTRLTNRMERLTALRRYAEELPQNSYERMVTLPFEEARLEGHIARDRRMIERYGALLRELGVPIDPQDTQCKADREKADNQD
jgi:hypothetical protein